MCHLCQDCWGILHEERSIDLDTPLCNYLPESGIVDDPRIPGITLRTVLSHTCGLPNWRAEGQPLQLCLTPGERFSYSGEGFHYLQRVIAHLLGESGESFMQRRLLKPLGMTHSSYLWRGSEGLPLANGHNSDGTPATKWQNETMRAAFSLHATPSDFAQMIIAMMRPLTDQHFQLSAATLDLMLTPQIQVNDSAPWHDDWPTAQIELDPRVAWGLGWGLQLDRQPPSFWHWGDNFTYTAFAVGFRETGAGLVIMTNSGGGYELFEQICHDALGGDYPSICWLRRLFR